MSNVKVFATQDGKLLADQLNMTHYIDLYHTHVDQ